MQDFPKELIYYKLTVERG